MLQRGDPGHVLVQHVMLPQLGRQNPPMAEGGVEAAGRPEQGGIKDQAERPEGEKSWPSIVNSSTTRPRYKASSVATVSGFPSASSFSSASRMCRDSREVPGMTICPMPTARS
nr:hypothetical protein [Streptomyces sp. NRRL S-646]